MFPCLAHHVQIESEIVLAGYHRRKHLSGYEQVMKVCAAVCMVNERSAERVYLGEVIRPFCIAHVHYAVPCEKHTVTAVPGRHNAIEHVHSPGYRFKQVRRRTDSHKIPGLVSWNHGIQQFQHLIHHFRRFPYRKTSYRNAGLRILERMLRGLHPEIRIDAPLYDGEERL